jgi:thioredoxin reductase (NADPH)
MSPVRPTVKVVGARLDPVAHELRDLLTRAAQPYEWFEADSPEASSLLTQLDVAEPALPLVVDGDAVLTGMTARGLADAWKLTAPPKRAHYDFAISGAGPAGLAAAVYAASDGLSTIVLERDLPGGQASHTSLIENFFGFPDGIGGAELARLAGRQAERFGAEIMVLRGVAAGEHRGDMTRIELDGGAEITASVMLAAPGMVWRRLEADGLDDLLGRGVYYGAGRSEAARCADEDVVVVGAGNSAGQAVINLANAGARVKMLVRGPDLGKTMSAYLVDRIRDCDSIEVRLEAELTAAHADDDEHLSHVSVRSARAAGETLPASAIFLCIGGRPRTDWAAGAGVETDGAGYILTGPDLLRDGRRPEGWPLARDPLALETSVPGVFAAGDARHGSTKRVAGAVGEGAMAAALAFRRLTELGISA